MSKNILFLLLITASSGDLRSQDLSTFHLYHPEENAAAGIAGAVRNAAAAHKNVFIQIGGNWCIWCARFHEMSTNDPQVDSAFNANFVVYHLNFSRENENLPTMATLGFPQRFGFPVFVILNSQGTLLHIQNSGYLEERKGYNKEKVISFLNDWSPKAVDPATYNVHE
jgi:thioredoxin-related protein